MSKRLLSIGDFIEELKSFEQRVITRDAVLELCSSVQISDSSLEPYVVFRDSFYTRNLVYRDDLFEVMTICWQPGQKTPVHTHNGQLCWMIMQRGVLEVVDYRWLGCDHPEYQNVVGIDCLAGSDHIKLDQLQRTIATTDGPVLTADKLQTIHQLFTSREEPEQAISIHVYSRPIDSCVAFDMERNQCYRRELTYTSEYGELIQPRPSLPSPLVTISR